MWWTRTGTIDGDTDIDTDTQTDGDTDTDEGSCPLVHQGEVLRLDVPTVRVRINATVNGQPYIDLEGTSIVYLRDNDTGNQFAVYKNVSDGSALPEIDVMAGDYNLVMQNSMGQKATCAEHVSMTQDGVL